MLACIDVDYRSEGAVAACVLFADWTAERGEARQVVAIRTVAPYVPGKFYLRELPCLLEVLGRVREVPEVVVVDGYVWLGGEDKPGLGAHLFQALDGAAAVVGVSKSRFAGAGPAVEVFRGRSRRPLFVSAVGIDLDEAAGWVTGMSGPYRIPALLREVDRLCRSETGRISNT